MSEPEPGPDWRAWGDPADQLCVYLDWRDWWIGYYRGARHHYVCVLPCVVIRWPRRSAHP